MVPNIPPQEASNRLQIFQVKLHFFGYIDNVLLFFKMISGKKLMCFTLQWKSKCLKYIQILILF